MIHCTDTGTVDPDVVGRKAAELFALYRLSAGCSFTVPDFCVLPAGHLAEFQRRGGWESSLAYTRRPAPDDLPAGTGEALAGFTRFAGAAIEECAGVFDTPLILRSSLVVPDSEPSTGCGCNGTRLVGAESLTASRLIPDLLGSFYKAFTTWSLDPGRQWTSRTGGLVFMEAHPFRCLGSVWVEHDRLSVEVDGKYPMARQRYVCDPEGRPTHPVEHEVLRPEDLKTLAVACADLAAQGALRGRAGEDGPAEVEFGIGLDNDRLFVVQVRPLGGSAGTTRRRAGAFHTVGTVEGDLRDLRTARRAAAEGAPSTPAGGADPAEAAVAAGDVLLLVRESAGRADLFAHAWEWSTGSAAPPAGVLVEDTGAIAYGAGFRNHLVRRLMECRPDVFLGQVSAGVVEGRPRGVVARSDGSRLELFTARRTERRVP